MKETRKEKATHEKIPVRITDTTLRDAHQSLWATRMRREDIAGIVDVVDQAGYYSLEVWGGATFDVCLRFLREDPWDRLRFIRSQTKTPLQMLLRGQNLVGYRNYADDLLDRFVALSCKNGMDIFRVFDALNDSRNVEAAIRAVKKHGGHAQGVLCYTISPVHTIEKFVQLAKEQVEIGADSICIKDMAGILSPLQAEKLVGALTTELDDVPVQLHCHASSGMAAAVYLEAVRAGAGAIDCAISTMGGFSAQPPVETMLAMFEGTDYETHLDKEALERIAHYFVPIDAVRRQNKGREPAIDPEILIHQVPGGMISNFRSQLAQQKALDKLPEVLKEVSRVREDLGYPPLVTPTSQIVGTQAVMNIIAGERYKIVPKEVKDYVRGLYGRSPAPIDPAFVKKILGDEKPITSRPADTIPPMLPKATEGIDPKYIKSEEDIVSYVMLPEPTLEFFKWRDLPPDKRPPVPADVEAQKAAAAAAPKEAAPAASTPAAAPAAAPRVAAAGSPEPMLHPEDYRGLSEVVSHLSGVAFDEVSFRKGDFVMRIAGAPGAPTVTARPAAVSIAPPPTAAAVAPAPAPTAEPTLAAAPAPAVAEAYGRTINAPLVGTFYSTPGPGKPKFVAVGDTVEAGARVCSVEAMKLFNEIAAPVRCKIVKILVEDGTLVEKDQPLIAIEAL